MEEKAAGSTCLELVERLMQLTCESLILSCKISSDSAGGIRVYIREPFGRLLQYSYFLSLPRDIMDKIRDVHHYKQETTRKGSMKIEVVVEEAKKPKKERPGSASSIRNIEDIQKRQKV